MERLGEILRNTRQEKGLTLDQVEKDTNIRQQYLEAMENEQWSVFPEYVYLKSFLRTYCRYLELENRDYLYFLIEDLKPKAKPCPPKLPEKIDLTAAPRRKTGIFLGIIAIVLLFTTSYVYKEYLFPSPHLSEVAKLDENKETLLPDQAELEQSEATQSEQNQAEQIEPEPESGSESEQWEQEQPPEESNTFRVSLKCVDDRCWVEVKNSEDEHIYQGIIAKDEEISFKNLQKVTLKLGNAGQVQVAINEENLGVLGEIGEVVTKTYVLENEAVKEL